MGYSNILIFSNIHLSLESSSQNWILYPLPPRGLFSVTKKNLLPFSRKSQTEISFWSCHIFLHYPGHKILNPLTVEMSPSWRERWNFVWSLHWGPEDNFILCFPITFKKKSLTFAWKGGFMFLPHAPKSKQTQWLSGIQRSYRDRFSGKYFNQVCISTPFLKYMPQNDVIWKRGGGNHFNHVWFYRTVCGPG